MPTPFVDADPEMPLNQDLKAEVSLREVTSHSELHALAHAWHEDELVGEDPGVWLGEGHQTLWLAGLAVTDGNADGASFVALCAPGEDHAAQHFFNYLNDDLLDLLDEELPATLTTDRDDLEAGLRSLNVADLKILRAPEASAFQQAAAEHLSAWVDASDFED